MLLKIGDYHAHHFLIGSATSARPHRLGHILLTMLVLMTRATSPSFAQSSDPSLGSVSFLQINPTTVAGGTSSTGSVTLVGNAALYGTVALTSDNAAVVVPSSVTCAPAPGALSSSGAKFTVTTTPVTTSVTAHITASYAGTSKTATLTVSVSSSPVLTSIAVSPASASLSLNGIQQFTAVAKDQNGNALATQPAFTWTSTGVGTIGGSTGKYTAAMTAGSATVKAASGTISGTAAVTVTNAAPTVATAAAATPSTVAGTTTALSVLGADDGGEANLTYTWATTGTPPAGVLFSASGTNAAKNTTVTFTKAGTYGFLVTIKDAGGLSVTSSVSVTVSQTLTGIAVSPNPATLNTGGTQQFTAAANDQFGTALSTQPAFTWTWTGVGMITAAGLYSAGTTAGTATVKAASGTVSGNAAVTVNPASRIQITNINNGDSLSGDVDVSVFITGGSTGFGDVNLYVDGVMLDSGQPAPDGQGNNTMTITVPSNEYTNGTHQIKISDSLGNSDVRTVSFNNVIGSLRYDPIFDTSTSASDVPHTAQISATLSSSQQWQIQIQDDSSNVINSFSGSGTSINVTWNGTNSSGTTVDDDSYEFTITTTPLTGSSSSAAASSQGGSSANSVTLPIAKDSIGDSLVLMDINAFVNGATTKIANAKSYAKFLHSQFDPKVGIDFTQKVVILKVTPYSMTASQSLRSRINNKFKVPLNLVYVLAHGNSQPCPYFKIGLSTWYSKDPSTIVDPFSYNVRKTVTDAGLGYGEEINPPTLVWMDNCQSAGFNPVNHDFSWADTFAIGGEGMFLGWSTGGTGGIYNAATYGFAPSDPLFNWNGWRQLLWLNLFSYGNDFIISLNNADQVMRNGTNDPQQLHQYIGNQHAAF